MSTMNHATEQNRSFHRSLRYSVAVAALLIVLVIELVVPARRQSAVFDEGCHAFAGYSYWNRADFGVNPEHPPAVKLLAMLPLGKSLNFPPRQDVGFKWECFSGGKQFLYSNTVGADSILIRGRIAAATLTLLAAVLTFAIAYEMFGAAVGLLALLLFVFEPNLLAHGSLITTDMGMTAFLVATIYAFYGYMKKPSIVRLVLTGLAAGLALGAKFSGPLIFVMLPILMICEVLRHSSDSKLADGGRLKHALRLAGVLALVAAMSVTILWSFYGFRYTARPAGQAIKPPLEKYVSQLESPRTEKMLLFISRHHLLPEAYLFGLADVIITPRWLQSYIFGKLYRHGQWFYFPGAFVIKTTLGLLALLLLAFPIAVAVRPGPPWREFLFLAIPLLVYLAAAVKSNFNIGVRHILPIYPFAITLAAYAAWSLGRSRKSCMYAVSAMVIFSVVSSVRAFPNYLPYSNEIWGGPSRTFRVLTDSNVDWGQELKQVKAYVDENGIKDCWFEYYGRLIADPDYYRIPCKPLQSAMGDPVPTPAHISGTVLISATDLTPALWGPGELNPYLLFTKRPPDDSIANGVFVFRGDFDIPQASAMAHAGSAWTLLNSAKPTDAQINQALIEAQAAVTLSPDICASCQEILGDVLMKLNRKDEALAAYKKGLADAQAIYPEFQDGQIASLKSKLPQ
jgi:hypothetical protein